MRFVIARPIEGITLNGDEYILEADNVTIKLFDSIDEAKLYLTENGVESSLYSGEVHIKGYNEVTREIFFL